MRHAGMGFAQGAADVGAILALPSPDLLMLATEHWHYDRAVDAGKRVVWRAIPRIGRRPAELGYDAARFADEVLNLTDRAGRGIRSFIGWNEPDLNGERGDGEDDYADLPARYERLGRFLLAVVGRLREKLPGVELHFGAWTPDHHALDHLDAWRPAAEACDVVDFHAYGSLDAIRAAYEAYRSAFPGKRLALTEWHCYGDVAEERRVLAWLARAMAADELFVAAYRFIWSWADPADWWRPEMAVATNPDALALFTDPPIYEEATVTNPWEWWTAERLAEVTGCPVENVRSDWPLLDAAMEARGLRTRANMAAVAGTVAIESASTFKPVREAFWLDEEWRRANLRYYPHYGRGHLQATWPANYLGFGEADGVGDLYVREPDRLLEPETSARFLAWFWSVKGVMAKDGSRWYSLSDLAAEGDTLWIRKVVQGGTDGLGRLVDVFGRLMAGSGAPATRLYSLDVPEHVEQQRNDWTCAVRSLYAGLWSMRQAGHLDFEPTYGDEGSRDVYDLLVPRFDNSGSGLLDASGAGIVQALGEWGVSAGHDGEVSLADVQARAGRQPVMIGGRRWGPAGHWVYVRGVQGDGTLVLENPAGRYDGIEDELLDSFGRLGPFSMVWIDVPPTEEGEDPVRIAELEQERDAARAERDAALERVKELETVRGHLTVNVAGALQAAVDELRRHAA